ncbi:hypothetical protein BDV95DRAFT_580481 [Massariosphaeria phaeospora]|uniref:DUF7025 domain-containing protein n=1 Tax=Massariosphaeria phaeospora TaxID=100035 RepID=A0A7C8I1C0_9PLEO|nr:hypothetical protein BDV95DRAFT_580481 [Massariosphaeria phaeospora]
MHKARTDLATLLSHIRATQEVTSSFGGLEASNTSQIVQFEYLWTLFPPGELVYSTVFMKRPQVFIVKDSSSYIERDGDDSRDKEQRKV